MSDRSRGRRSIADEAVLDLVGATCPDLREVAEAAVRRQEKRRRSVIEERRRRFLDRIDRGEVTL